MAADWQLGVAADPLPGHERYQGRLCVPYLTPAGTVDLKFRCILPHECKEIPDHVKYLGLDGSLARLFGVWNLARDSRFVCLCEGEMDTIAATSLAGLPAVGVSGVQKWQPHWQYCLEGYDEVLILADGDSAGDTMGEKVAARLHNGRVIRMPRGHDVNSLIVERGADALLERLGMDDE